MQMLLWLIYVTAGCLIVSLMETTCACVTHRCLFVADAIYYCTMAHSNSIEGIQTAVVLKYRFFFGKCTLIFTKNITNSNCINNSLIYSFHNGSLSQSHISIVPFMVMVRVTRTGN